MNTSACISKSNYITICGPDLLGRFGDGRQIDIVQFLPDYLRGAETEDFLILFQNFLNNMYDGLGGWQLSSTEIDVDQDWITSGNSPSATALQNFTYEISGVSAFTDATSVEQLKLNWPTNASYVTSAQKISILEKVSRLTELHDPDLIDLQYIQFYAANLGYDINISRNELGNSGTNDNFGTTELIEACSAVDINRYLRFVVQNLPSWYKIKTTRNSIKVMLYSFGLVADIIEYFTNNYKSFSANGRWRYNIDNSVTGIDPSYFPTPHFAIIVDFDLSSDISFDVARRQKVINAIESIRPVNTVFRRLVGFVNRNIDLLAAGYIRSSRYMVIESNGYSNGWAG